MLLANWQLFKQMSAGLQPAVCAGTGRGSQIRGVALIVSARGSITRIRVSLSGAVTKDMSRAGVLEMSPRNSFGWIRMCPSNGRAWDPHQAGRRGTENPHVSECSSGARS